VFIVLLLNVLPKNSMRPLIPDKKKSGKVRQSICFFFSCFRSLCDNSYKSFILNRWTNAKNSFYQKFHDIFEKCCIFIEFLFLILKENVRVSSNAVGYHMFFLIAYLLKYLCTYLLTFSDYFDCPTLLTMFLKLDIWL